MQNHATHHMWVEFCGSGARVSRCQIQEVIIMAEAPLRVCVCVCDISE